MEPLDFSIYREYIKSHEKYDIYPVEAKDLKMPYYYYLHFSFDGDIYIIQTKEIKDNKLIIEKYYELVDSDQEKWEWKLPDDLSNTQIQLNIDDIEEQHSFAYVKELPAAGANKGGKRNRRTRRLARSARRNRSQTN